MFFSISSGRKLLTNKTKGVAVPKSEVRLARRANTAKLPVTFVAATP
jgi:hypothetical protein